MYIMVTGYAGLEGSRMILEDRACRERILSRYREDWFAALTESAESQDHTALSAASGTALMSEPASEGGVLAALWNVLRKAGLGARYSLRAIPIRQQTIEICEVFDIDPYRLHAPSCRVWLAEDPRLVIKEAEASHAPVSIIGHTDRGPAIWRTDPGSESCLRKPVPDELERLRPGFFLSASGN